MANSCKLSLTIAATVIVFIAAALPTEGYGTATFFEGPGCKGNNWSVWECEVCYNLTSYTGGYQYYHTGKEVLNFYSEPDCHSLNYTAYNDTWYCNKRIKQKSIMISCDIASGIRQVTAGK